MKKKVVVKLAAVLVLATIELPGCDFCSFTSAQLTGLFQDLSAVGVSAVFDAISAQANPAGNADLQAIIDIGEDAAQTCVDNRIDNQIPDDPRP